MRNKIVSENYEVIFKDDSMINIFFINHVHEREPIKKDGFDNAF